MNKFTIIPAGYRVTIMSWENDFDAHRTVTKSGLSFDEVKFHLELCSLLEIEQHGNMLDGENDEDYIAAIADVVEKYKTLIPNIVNDHIEFALNIVDL